MNISNIITFVCLIFLNFLLVGCQPGGDVESSFGTRVPTPTTGGSTGGNPSANLVSIVSGDKQHVAVGGTAALPLVVLVLQAPGQAVANETVYFQVVGGASRGSVSSASAVTNSSGYAEIYFTGGSYFGDVNIVASAPQGSVNFTTTVTDATGYALSKTSSNAGDGQVGNINSALAQRFRVALTDSSGDPVSGQNVRFVSVGTIQGNFSGAAFYDSMTNSSGIAESEVMTLSSTSGQHSINAYLIGDSSVKTVFSATSISPANSAIDPLKSKLILSPGMVAADGNSIVDATVEIRDVYNNLIPNGTYGGTISVTGDPASLYGSSWTGAGWNYTGVGTYKRTLIVGNTSGVINFSVTVNSIPFLSTMPSLNLTANSTVDNSKTTISSKVSPLSADGVSTTTIVVQLRDQFSNPVELSGQSLVLSTDMGTLTGSVVYNSATGTYRQLLIAPTSVGSGNLTVTLQSINSVPVGITQTIPLQAAAINASNSSISITDRIFTENSQTQTITLSLKDSNNNGITAPATINMNKAFQSGSLTGTFANSGAVTPIGNGIYQINLTSPSNTTSCSGVASVCTEDISATVTVGATTINLGPIRVQYKGTTMTPSAAHSYLVMNNSSVSVGGGNVLTGTIYLRTSTPDQYSVGGDKSKIALSFTGCSPTYTITDNNSGTYSIVINSPAASCTGQMTVRFDSAQIGTTSAPGTASANPFSFSFYGVLSLGQSVLTISPAIISGGGSTTASLEVKDDGGNNYPACSISTSLIRFQENHADTAPVGSVNCSVVGGKAIYTQSIERTTNTDEYGTVSISAQYNNSGWSSFSSMKTLQITPPNLAGYTIDCDNEASFRDKNIYVKDGTLTINGWVDGSIPTVNNCSPGNPIRFKTLRVGPNGILTHTKTTTTQAYGIDVFATDSITIEASGKIDVIGKGYLGARGADPANLGRGPGNIEMVPGAASYGGLGVSWHTKDTNNLTNRQATYGNPSDPNELGSGAGHHGWNYGETQLHGTDGGGLVRLKSPTMLIQGNIFADGQIGLWGPYGMAGSGGGIKLDLGGTGTLQGSGIISAAGGKVSGIDTIVGGGGRIAILGDMSSWTGSNPSVLGGGGWLASAPNPSYGSDLNNGTLYISKVPSTFTIPFSITLGPGESYFGSAINITIPTGYTLRLGSVVNWDTLAVNGRLTFLNSGKVLSRIVTVSSGATVTHEAITASNGTPKVEIEATQLISIDSGASVTVSEKGYPGTTAPNQLSVGYGPGMAVYATGQGSWSEACNNNNQGGNHYKRGGATITSLNTYSTWGDPESPNTHGGAGACGTFGGGVLRLVSDTIELGTSLYANGGLASAGGSIYLSANHIAVGGSVNLEAKGGTSYKVGAIHSTGAGGLITVNRRTLSGSYVSDITGGINISGVKKAEDGVYTEIIRP